MRGKSRGLLWAGSPGSRRAETEVRVQGVYRVCSGVHTWGGKGGEGEGREVKEGSCSEEGCDLAHPRQGFSAGPTAAEG